MVSRHRIPTIFNLSMVDVLCCALGCVILLWLLNLREAKQRAATAGQTQERLSQSQQLAARTQAERDETRNRLKSLQGERDALNQLTKNLEVEKAGLGMSLDKQTRANQDLQSRLAAFSQRSERLETQLKEKEALIDSTARNNRDLASQLRSKEALVDSTSRNVRDLMSQIRAKESLVDSTSRNARDLASQLRLAEARAKEMGSSLDQIPTLKNQIAKADKRVRSLEADLQERRKTLDVTDKTVQALEEENRRLTKTLAAGKGDLALVERRVRGLEEEKKGLQEQVTRTVAAVENRFAGITLSGRRVVFLVDMSGSMELVDEKTPSTEKWAEVRNTLARIMQSLPELEKFQVLLFSDKVTHVLGNEDRWIPFDPKTSVDRTLQAISSIKPHGGTNMAAAFESAFRFRSRGLDVVYVLSDGLPNIGDGLTNEQARTLRETDQTEILSKYVRKSLKENWNSTASGKPRVRINTVGFFYESPDVGAFLWALARENDGSFVGMSRP